MGSASIIEPGATMIDTAIDHGYLNPIPVSIFSKQVSVALAVE
jgi:hypothetical protein